MLKNIFHVLSVLIVLSFGQLVAQEITVLDEVTQERIPGVKVYSIEPKVQVIADLNGRFQLEDFKGCDTIYISYPDYETKIFLYKDLQKVVWVELSDEHLTVSEVVVTANRWGEDKSKVAGKIEKLNLKDLGIFEAQTTADLLEASGYVFVQKSQLAGGSPQLRGFGTNRVMIVVDGVRMNNAIFRSGNLQNIISLDGNSLESAEIQFGPGSVIYGSDAIGGVMNFTTIQPKFSTDSLKPKVKTTIFTRYSSASNESTTHLDFNYGTEKWATSTAITFSHFGDLKTGKYGNSYFLRPTFQTTMNGVDTTVVNPDPRKQIETGYNQVNFIHKLIFKLNEKWNLSYGLNFSKSSNAPRYDRLIQDVDNDGVLDKAEWYYGPQEWVMNRLSVVNQDEHVLFDHLRITLAYQNFKESRHDRKTGNTLIRRQFEKVDALSLNIDFQKKWGERTVFFYGAEAVFNYVGSYAYKESILDGSQTIINPRYPDKSTRQTYGLYFSSKFDLSEKWTLNSGVRYSIYLIDAKFDTTLFAFPSTEVTNNSGALNGSLGLVFNPSIYSQFYVNFSTGYRAPNIDDIGKVFDSEPGSVIVPNVNLKPEYAYNAEFGIVQAIKSHLKIEGAIYGTYLENALARSPFQFDGQDSILYEGVYSQVLAIQNVSNAYVYGVQGGVEFVFGKGFILKSMISYQKGFEYSIDSASYFPKAHVAPLFGRTSIAYKRRHLHIEVYTIYQGRMDYEDMPLLERDDFEYAKDENGLSFTPAWYTINVKGAYFFNKHLSLNLGLENITNQLYRTVGSGISAPGINFTTSLKVVF